MSICLADAAPRLGSALADEPHHDGSPRYVPNPPTALGEQFDVWLRVPDAAGVTRVVARQVHDGEPFGARATPERAEAGVTWWRATLTQANPVINYRFLTDGGPFGYRWVTAAGLCDGDPTDEGDFRSSIYPGGPPWLRQTVAYQVFPDRFASTHAGGHQTPEWAQAADWDDDPIPVRPGAGRQFYGGDLPGVTAHLDHLAALGVTLLYLTPFFPAPSNHRYNASSFDVVDPLLGGDQALIDLVAAAHARGIRVIGDLTTNHTGSHHEWFQAALADPLAPEVQYYFFDSHPDDYVGWFGVASLPKVNHASAGLRERMLTGQMSPLRRYLREPFNLDGWRIDVANMTGRHADKDLNAEVAREVRAAVVAERPDAYVVGEHFHDFRTDALGDGWHGVMNYAGFAKPLWTWLAGQGGRQTNTLEHWLGLGWAPWPELPGESVVASMRAFTAVPWHVLNDSFTLLSSHDTPRIATIAGSPELVAVGVGALMTYPGVPMVWAGDEIGLTGANGEGGRRTMPWEQPAAWQHETLACYQELVAVRTDSSALQSGSLRWVYADADRIAYVREDEHELVLVLLARAVGPEISLSAASVGVRPEAQPDILYGNSPAEMAGDTVVLPGAGPTVHIWRWGGLRPCDDQQRSGGSHGQSGA